MFTGLDISTSGMSAQRTRMLVRSQNLANISSTRNEDGEVKPYQPRFVEFAAKSMGSEGALGVEVTDVKTSKVPPRLKYDPHHPDAIKEGKHKGYVQLPQINMLSEMSNAMEAQRTYEANLNAFQMNVEIHKKDLQILS